MDWDCCDDADGGIGSRYLYYQQHEDETLPVPGERQFELAYGVESIVKQRSESVAKTYLVKTIAGVLLCILSFVPLVLAGTMYADYMTMIACTALLFVMIAAGVYLLVTGGTVKSGYSQLLMEDEYDPEMKEKTKKIAKIGGIFWPLVVAVYVGWSLLSGNWGITWIVWPVAALVFVGLTVAFGGGQEK